MSNLMFYATRDDAKVLCDWINSEPDVAWIVKDDEECGVYRWRAVCEIEALVPREYAIWNVHSGQLNVPSGSPSVPDAVVANPFVGWSQKLGTPNKSAPWFGANLPGPYHLEFKIEGRERQASLGRSEFAWAANRFRTIGKPAHPAALSWWNRLRRFLSVSASVEPWLPGSKSPKVYIFPEALAEISAGRHRDVNP